ncbi:uncharacterized protein LOC143526921 [Brachyhypopomus gauderio]|uniref:uncharacterized protein LOC143526921 n=1 Tax=Brachyhypopomus gauderio TaxID=698409 RepID=UPI0040430A4B
MRPERRDPGTLQNMQNPLKTLMPVNASRRRVVDKQLDPLIFCWRQKEQQAGVQSPSLSYCEEQTQHATPQITCHANSLSPFYTVGKPTCGYRFSWSTDHRRRHTGIAPSNIVMWRSTSK